MNSFSAALAAATALGASDSPEKTDTTYSHLNLAREEMVKWAAKLKHRAGVDRTVFLRF